MVIITVTEILSLVILMADIIQQETQNNVIYILSPMCSFNKISGRKLHYLTLD